MPSIHPVALDSDIHFLRHSNMVNMVKILIGTCVNAANTHHVCELVNLFHYVTSMNPMLQTLLQGKTGPNLVTVTCVNPETFARAEREPQKIDFICNCMGGWINFFISSQSIKSSTDIVQRTFPM